MSLIRFPFGSRAGERRVEVVHDLETLRVGLDELRSRNRTVALVPTMGNLHAGHLALVKRAGEIADVSVATVFVNPFQFGKNEDFDTYPRTFDRDVEALEQAGCQVLFAPTADEVYPFGPEGAARVEVPALGGMLCGESRPTFFRGVATVVNILFNMVQPDVALFGVKDFQQLLIVRRMVRTLHLRTRIEAVDTVREADGVAMSSRNNYLSAEQRSRAPALYRALSEARDALAGGDTDFSGLCQRGVESLSEAGFRPEYFAVRRPEDLSEPEPGDRELVVLAAAWLGQTRLIDNVMVPVAGRR